MNHPTQEDLVLVYYHEGEPDTAAHVMSCPSCRAELETIRRVLHAVDSAETPEPESGWDDAVWNRLRWKLGARRSALPLWSIGAIAAALLVAAFLGGRLWQRSTVPAATTAATAVTSAEGRDRIFLVVVGDHLDRSERILLELANQGESAPPSLAAEQRIAGDLVKSNRIYRQTALQAGNGRLASLLEELEPILVEIANAPPDPTPRELEFLRKRIESKALVFKLRVASEGARKPTTDTLAAAGELDL